MTLTFDHQNLISSFSGPSERIVVLYCWDAALKRMRWTDEPGIYHRNLSLFFFFFQRPPISKRRQSNYWQETSNCSLIWLWLLLWSLDSKRFIILLNSAWAPSMKSWVGPAGESLLHILRRLHNHEVHTDARNQSTTSIPVDRYWSIGGTSVSAYMLSISANIYLILLYIKFILLEFQWKLMFSAALSFKTIKVYCSSI